MFCMNRQSSHDFFIPFRKIILLLTAVFMEEINSMVIEYDMPINYAICECSSFDSIAIDGFDLCTVLVPAPDANDCMIAKLHM